MADYFSQTVIRPDIPRSAMTGLEYAALCQIFGHEDVGEDIYFFAAHGPNDFVLLDAELVRSLLAADDGVDSALAAQFREALAAAPPDADTIELDVSVVSFEGILQDIVARSALDYIEVETAWSCSKMHPDGFGGSATLITSDDIQTVSTSAWLDEAIASLSPAKPS